MVNKALLSKKNKEKGNEIAVYEFFAAHGWMQSLLFFIVNLHTYT